MGYTWEHLSFEVSLRFWIGLKTCFKKICYEYHFWGISTYICYLTVFEYLCITTSEWSASDQTRARQERGGRNESNLARIINKLKIKRLRVIIVKEKRWNCSWIVFEIIRVCEFELSGCMNFKIKLEISLEGKKYILCVRLYLSSIQVQISKNSINYKPIVTCDTPMN